MERCRGIVRRGCIFRGRGTLIGIRAISLLVRLLATFFGGGDGYGIAIEAVEAKEKLSPNVGDNTNLSHWLSCVRGWREEGVEVLVRTFILRGKDPTLECVMIEATLLEGGDSGTMSCLYIS